MSTLASGRSSPACPRNRSRPATLSMLKRSRDWADAAVAATCNSAVSAREHVVEERVEVGELDERSSCDRHHTRDEGFVFLEDLPPHHRQRPGVRNILQVRDDVLYFG